MVRRDATADSSINWSNSTALIHGLDEFQAHKSAILLSAIFRVNYLILQNY